MGVVVPEAVGAGGGGGRLGAAAGVRRPGLGGSEGGRIAGEIGEEAAWV